MAITVGIRRTSKNRWERRTPLMPEAVEALQQHSLNFVVQPSSNRIIPQEAYLAAGAQISDDLTECKVILDIKEIPPSEILTDKVYLFFSHTIKGQDYNMPMLQKLLDANCTLIDYECIVDDNHKRLIFFGFQAGQAGMINALFSLGQRLKALGINSPFKEFKQAREYGDTESAKRDLAKIGESIRQQGLPDQLTPFIVGISGRGNVAKGAGDILSVLPVEDISPDDLMGPNRRTQFSPNCLYRAVFLASDIYRLSDDSKPDREMIHLHPEKLSAVFENVVPSLGIFVNGIYWEPRYPRLITTAGLKKSWSDDREFRLKVIADVTCDIEGSVECTLEAADPGNPSYVYNPLTQEIRSGFEGEGLVVMAVDILPAELPRESSEQFSAVLAKFLPHIVGADYTGPFAELDLPAPIRRAVIAHQGKLAPEFAYLYDALARAL